MKVLIISAFPPDPAPEANHALHMSEQLAKAGHTVHVLCKRGSIAATEPGMVVHPVINDWSWSDLPRLARCLKSCRPDVVLLLYLGWIYHHEPMITFLPTICKRILPGVPCITQFESVDRGCPPRSLGRRALRKAMALWAGRQDVHWLFGTLLRDSAHIIALSSPHRTYLMNHDSGVEEKSTILPPPPLIRFCPDDPATAREQVREAIGAAETDFVLIYWGYIYPGKGVETLLEAFRIVCRRNSNMRLLLVGGNLEIRNAPTSSSAYDHMVHQLPETLGIADKVTWTGHFNWDSDAGSRYLYGGDVCILPIDWGVTLNNSSLAAASTHGLPVIATELSMGQDEMLEHGKNIYLCRPRDPEMLAEAIQLVCENTGLRERLRLGIRDLARDWHRWENHTKRLVGVLESAVSSGKVPGREQSQSYVATNGTESSKKRIASEMRPHNGDDALPTVQGNNTHPASSVWSEENASDNVTAPLVSVIIAAHNVEKYLSQCLDSLVHQTLKNIEIIVVNDASTDNSLAIMQEYRSRYPTLRVVDCKKNLGLASVRNIGMRVAKGRYIGFTDADDWADIRMCEMMYRRASEDNADVVIADATVFHEDSKRFSELFDHHIRRTLDPRLSSMPFELCREPRVLLLELVAWTKLYKRSFLQEHALQFEDGMNSYEDICFHFSVLVKAARISLLDDALLFYRKNRPGQITARTSRKVFEVFAVFEKIHENLVAWEVPAEIWAMLVKVQLRQFDWLLTDRVQVRHKREFLGLVAKQFQMIPEGGFQNFAQRAKPDELLKLLFMRRKWLRAYEKVTRNGLPLVPLFSVLLHEGRGSVLKRGCQHGVAMLRRRGTSFVRSFVSKLLHMTAFEEKLQATHDSLQQQLSTVKALNPPRGEPLTATCRIKEQVFFFSAPSNRSGLGDAIWRMTNDYYLTRMAVFREGDIVIDVGAHVGVVSLYLAKKFPFLQVYAIEPDPLNFACLMRNIELNDVTNVVAINKAVSGDGQTKTLYADAWETTWATIDARMVSTHRVLRTTQVESVPLEQLFQKYAIRHCRLLKITALGAIQEILQGFTRSGCVDLLCGEADLADCSRAQLEMASWRIARQHGWRMIARQANGTVYSWLHQLPTGIEQANAPIGSTIRPPLEHSLAEQ